MPTNATTYVSGLAHPEAWLHDRDQVVLIVGMSWWYLLTVLLCGMLACVFPSVRKTPIVLSSMARIVVYCLGLGVAYMYTSARLFLYLRADDVLVRTWLVIGNGVIQVLLIYVGSIHCLLSPVHDKWVLYIGVFANFQTVLASFAAAEQQWAGWTIGALCNIPIPLLWLTTQQRSRRGQTWDPHVLAWIALWLSYRTAFAVLQLTGHTFSALGGLDTTAELSLTLVLHTLTLAPLIYATVKARAPPAPAGKYSTAMSNGDTIVVEVPVGA